MQVKGQVDKRKQNIKLHTFIDTIMKIIILFALGTLLKTCFYDPQKGKDLIIHNQTNSFVVVLDSLNIEKIALYDTALVNGRMYISRKPNYLTEFNNFKKFISNSYILKLRKNKIDKLTFYFIDKINLGKSPNQILTNHLYRSIEINLDTLDKYKLNHLFLTDNSILLEHEHDFITNWKQDTDTKAPVTTTSNSNAEKFYFVERASQDSKDYSVMVRSIYLLTDTLKYDSSYYCEANFLYLTNKTNNSVDSLRLEGGCEEGVLIEDFTQKLRFKNPVFNVAIPGGSDTYTNVFIEYKNGSLKKIFEIHNYNTVDLNRKDEHTLTGFVKDRDEVVSNFQDYPVIVSLDDYSVKVIRPPNQEIGYETHALSDFEGYQIIGNAKKRYVIKEGTPLLIDSINRKTNIVRLKIKDTIIVYIPLLQIKEKVQENTAG